MEPSLYIHIPFCRRKCTYCNFYSDIYNFDTASSYIDVLAEQAEGIEATPSTIYIGGGTPTILDKMTLERLLKHLRRLSCNDREFTMEANPDSIDLDKLKFLLDNGVNRISIGIQSLDERKLKKIGRVHSAEKALKSLSLARRAGFKNIGIDLIFGIWQEDIESWKRELEACARLPITHVSCYELTYEKGTPLFNLLSAGTVKPIEDDIAAAMYEMAIDILSISGFKQYEVSNFAKAGFECAHNLNYWSNNEYAGLGASAVSYIAGVRARNIPNIGEYIGRFQQGKSVTDSSEKLSPVRRAKETAAVKIRTSRGIDFKWFKEKTGYDFCELEKKALPRLIEDGLIKYVKQGKILTGICLKRKGVLFCDTVSSSLL